MRAQLGSQACSCQSHRAARRYGLGLKPLPGFQLLSCTRPTHTVLNCAAANERAGSPPSHEGGSKHRSAAGRRHPLPGLIAGPLPANLLPAPLRLPIGRPQQARSHRRSAPPAPSAMGARVALLLALAALSASPCLGAGACGERHPALGPSGALQPGRSKSAAARLSGAGEHTNVHAAGCRGAEAPKRPPPPPLLLPLQPLPQQMTAVGSGRRRLQLTLQLVTSSRQRSHALSCRLPRCHSHTMSLAADRTSAAIIGGCAGVSPANKCGCCDALTDVFEDDWCAANYDAVSCPRSSTYCWKPRRPGGVPVCCWWGRP